RILSAGFAHANRLRAITITIKSAIVLFINHSSVDVYLYLKFKVIVHAFLYTTKTIFLMHSNSTEAITQF
ncbi:MAG: hypothetical protein IJC26_04420, partial [Clostridia bacterium]|nr:hypothetical protein [Clostridia bacterium]